MPNPVHWIDPLGLMVDNKNKEDHTGGGLKQSLDDLGQPPSVDDPLANYKNPVANDIGEGVQVASDDEWIGFKKNADGDSIICIGEDACADPSNVRDMTRGEIILDTIEMAPLGKVTKIIPKSVKKKITGYTSKLNISDYKLPNGKITKVARDGNSIVQLDKVEKYMRGKSPDVSKELKEMNAFKQSNRKAFDANPENAEKLKKLKQQNKNYFRSTDMNRNLENAGLPNTLENNELITQNLLEAGKKASKDNRTVRSAISGSKGSVKIESTWKILDDGNNYLSTVKVIPAN